MKRSKKSLKSEFQEALVLNDATYNDYLARMRKIALSMFEWNNLPDTMNARYLEMCLFYRGQAAMLYDTNYGFINTQACDSGYINIYGLPTQINCYSYQYNEIRGLYVPDANLKKEQECILVMNTFERTPTDASICLFAKRLADAQRTCDINVQAQRTPVLILGDRNQEFTLKQMYAQYDGNSPVIYGNPNQIAVDTMKVFKTDAPFVAKDLMEYKVEIWNEFLTFLGINNLAEKRERLISNEVDSNNELVNLNLQSYLAPRKQACAEFNQKFGLTGDKAITVKVRSDLYNVIKQAESITDEYRSVIEKEEGENE